MNFNMTSVNVCSKCRRRNLHIDAVRAGYHECPTCIYERNKHYYNEIQNKNS